MMNIQINAGMATLPTQFLALRNAIDECALLIGDGLVAQRYQFPALIPVGAIDQFDYFKNFPHLPLVVSHTKPNELSAARSAHEALLTEMPQELVEAGSFVLPPAACYNVYLHLQDKCLEHMRTFSTVAQCFRKESHYNGLQRLQSFTMREVVFVGPKDDVQEGLEVVRKRVVGLAESLGIKTTLEQAADPFFQADSPRALMQKLTSVKQELVYGATLAISSFNFHRNFFGERCRIKTSDGDFAYSACMGIGLERWLHALLETHNQDVEGALAMVNGLAREMQQRAVSVESRNKEVAYCQ